MSNITKVALMGPSSIAVDFEDGTTYLVNKDDGFEPTVSVTNVRAGDLSSDLVVFEAPVPEKVYSVGDVLAKDDKVDFGDKRALILYGDNSFGWTDRSCFGDNRVIVAIENEEDVDPNNTAKTVVAFLRGEV